MYKMNHIDRTFVNWFALVAVRLPNDVLRSATIALSNDFYSFVDLFLDHSDYDIDPVLLRSLVERYYHFLYMVFLCLCEIRGISLGE